MRLLRACSSPCGSDVNVKGPSATPRPLC
jgi:hypothetical protein